MREFIAHRAEIDARDPMTKRALTNATALLDRDCKSDEAKIKTIRKSIVAGYKGLFPDKRDNAESAGNPPPSTTITDEEYERRKQAYKERVGV